MNINIEKGNLKRDDDMYRYFIVTQEVWIHYSFLK